MFGVLAIFLPLILMIVLIWKKVNIVIAYFPLILLGSAFSKLMESCGASNDVTDLLAEKIGADYSMLIVIITSLVLTYGGVSFFMVAFAVYPIALQLWQRADLPRSLIPGAIAAGAFTAPNLGPGSPGIINVLPMSYLGTTATSAPLPYAVCCEADLGSKRASAGLDCPCHLLAHHGCFSDLDPIIAQNLALWDEALHLVQGLALEERTLESLTAAVLEAAGSPCRTPFQIMSAGRSVRSLAQYLVDMKRLSKRAVGGIYSYQSIG